MAERFAGKYEEVKEKQEDRNRMNKVHHGFHSQLPVLSASERDVKNELQLMLDQFWHLGNAIKKVIMKKDYQQQKMEKVPSPQKPTITLKCPPAVVRSLHPKSEGWAHRRNADSN